MEEWQRKLKAEKDAARQKKSESAEILHGYRGDLKDDELKLKAIRDEERKKAQDAQQILHNYKGVQLPDGATTKSKEQRTEQHFPTPVNAGQGPHRDDVLDAIVQGSVSERAAALAAAAEGVSSIPIPSGSSTHSASQNPATLASAGDVNASVPAVDNYDDDDDDDDFGPSLQPSPNEPLVNNSTVLQQTPSTFLANPIVSTTTDSVPIVTSDEIQPPISNPIEESVMVEKTPDIVAANGSSSITMPAKGIIPTPKQPLQRIDVLLAFGLVTISSPPNLESYMKAVETIATKSIQESNEEGAMMDPTYPPYVKDTKWDGTHLFFLCV